MNDTEMFKDVTKKKKKEEEFMERWSWTITLSVNLGLSRVEKYESKVEKQHLVQIWKKGWSEMV